MFSLLSPLALLGLACLAIPILIHLSRQNKTQRVVVGSIELLKKLPKHSVKQRKLSELLLLLIRLLIFLLASLYFAELVLNQKGNKDLPTSIVTQAWLAQTSETQINRFIAANGPDKISLVTVDGQIKSASINNSDQVKSAIQSLPITSGVESLTALQTISKQLANYDAKTLEKHVPNIYVSDVFYKDAIVKQRLYANVIDNHPTFQLHLKKTTAESLLADAQAALHILIVFDENRDTRFLEMALLALQKHHYTNMHISTYPTEQYVENQASLKVNILFDLSDVLKKDDFTESLLANGLIISDLGLDELPTLASNPLYQPANQLELNQLGLNQLGLGFSASLLPFPPLAQPINVAIFKQHTLLASERSVWQTQQNQPILIEQSISGEDLAHFSQVQLNTRFEPTWFSLVKQPEFPSILNQLFTQYAVANKQTAQLSASQIRQILNQYTQTYREGVVQHTSLNRYLLVLLIGLFIIERLLSEHSIHAALKKRQLSSTEVQSTKVLSTDVQSNGGLK